MDDSQSASGLEFRMLGALEIAIDGQERSVQGDKLQALLARLLLDRNRPVSPERLIDDLWGDRPPATGRQSLHAHVTRLRRVLDPEGGVSVLSNDGRGYILHVSDEQLDAERFRRLVAAARHERRNGAPDTARASYRDALALWRGPVLDGVPLAAAEGERAELDGIRLAALEERIDLDIELGAAAEVVPELEQIVRRDPLRERAWAQLMLALYASGRQGEALAAYQEARRTLAELGLEPGPGLRELERAILNQDPSLPTLPLRSGRSPRVRRRRALAALGALVSVGVVVLAVVVLRDQALEAAGGTTSPVGPNTVVKIDPATNEIVHVTPVGRKPGQLASAAGYVWVVNSRDRTLTRVSESGEVNTIGGVPYADHVAIDGDDVWVSSFDRSSVSRIDGKTAELVESIGIPSRHAEGLAIGGGYLWITNPSVKRAQGRETVSRLDLRTRKVVSTIRVGKTPIFTTFGFGSVWVSNYDDNTISVISPGSVKAEKIDVCQGPLGITAGYDSIWVVCYWDQRVVRVDPTTRRQVGWTWVGSGPLSVSAGEGGVWVTNRDTRDVYRIDPATNEVVAKIAVPAPSSPQGVVAGDGAVWVSLYECPETPCF